MKDEPSPEDSKLCPYCMGEISVNDTICSHCGENLEDKDRESLKQEGKDTVKREARKQIQDKLGKKTSQKSVAKSEGVKSWWAGQSTGLKALIVLCVGLVVIGGIYLSSGASQDSISQLTSDPIKVISDMVNPGDIFGGSNNDPNDKNSPAKNCTNCNGTGKIKESQTIYHWDRCHACNGEGYTKENKIIQKQVGTDPDSAPIYEYVQTTIFSGCTVCEGSGSGESLSSITKGSGEINVPETVLKDVECPVCHGKGTV